jgi:hypothetical protein
MNLGESTSILDKKGNELKKNDEYLINNFQFSRGYSNDKFNEYSFSIKDIEINFELLKQTVDKISTKMYVNWVNVIPVILEEYTKCKLYKNSIEFYKNRKDNYENIALSISDLYETLTTDLYLSTVDVKWLLFEKFYNSEYISYLDILNKIYPVYNFINDRYNSKWILLAESDKKIFNDNIDEFLDTILESKPYRNIPNDIINDFLF